MVETTTARFSYEGQKFEILVKPDQALEFKLGKRTDITSVLISEDIYTDSSKGNKPSDDMLTKAFKTNDTTKIAEIILKKGDLNLTTAQRRKMMDEKRKQIIEYIAKTYVDPRSHLPHPPLRIEQAMTDARVSIDPQKSADDQIKDIVDGLRGIIPLKSENIDLIITVPAQYAGFTSISNFCPSYENLAVVVSTMCGSMFLVIYLGSDMFSYHRHEKSYAIADFMDV